MNIFKVEIKQMYPTKLLWLLLTMSLGFLLGIIILVSWQNTGIRGVEGPSGPKGLRGATGPSGVAPIFATGAVGASGAQGAQGQRGNPGNVGPSGPPPSYNLASLQLLDPSLNTGSVITTQTGESTFAADFRVPGVPKLTLNSVQNNLSTGPAPTIDVETTSITTFGVTFNVPLPPDGVVGPKGITGVGGVEGDIGVSGATGPAQTIPGETGPVGESGPTGILNPAALMWQFGADPDNQLLSMGSNPFVSFSDILVPNGYLGIENSGFGTGTVFSFPQKGLYKVEYCVNGYNVAQQQQAPNVLYFNLLTNASNLGQASASLISDRQLYQDNASNTVGLSNYSTFFFVCDDTNVGLPQILFFLPSLPPSLPFNSDNFQLAMDLTTQTPVNGSISRYPITVTITQVAIDGTFVAPP